MPVVPSVNPSVLKAVNEFSVKSRLGRSLEIPFVAPLTESKSLWFLGSTLHFSQVKSGLNPTPVIDCVPPFPVYILVLKLLALVDAVVSGFAAMAQNK